MLENFKSYNNEEIDIITISFIYANELPKGSTAIDFAYKIHTNIGNTMVEQL